MSRPIRLAVWGIMVLLAMTGSTRAGGEITVSAEAEKCRVKKEALGEISSPMIWASGGACLNGWGRRGDLVAWRFVLPRPLTGGWLAVRYSCDEEHMRRRNEPSDPARLLVVALDARSTGSIHVPDTGGWTDFSTAYIGLPELPAGTHDLLFLSPSERVTTNLDCFTIGCQDPKDCLSLAMRSTVVARQTSPSLCVKMTPRAQVKWTPEELLAEFTRIYVWLSEKTGWKPARPTINIHIYEDRLMTGPTHADSFGVHFQASNMNWDKGNWVHEMLHVFHEGRFPAWLEHPLVRSFEAFDAIPGIFPVQREPLRTLQQQGRRKRYEQGLKLLKSPQMRTDDPHEPLYALRVRYGPTLIPNFYRSMREAGEQGAIMFAPGQPQPKQVIAHYLSEAAGENVLPILEQWTGWEKEP